MKKYYQSFLLLIVVSMFGFSCEEDLKSTPKIRVNLTEFNFIATGESHEIEIESNTEWTITLTPEDDWLSVDMARGNGDKIVTITATKNGKSQLRTVTLTFNATDVEPIEIVATQAAAAPGDALVVFEDANFKAALLADRSVEEMPESKTGHFPNKIDADGDGEISEKEAAEVTKMNVAKLDASSEKILKMSELSYFTALEDLNCSGNGLTALDVSKNIALTKLWCHSNDIIELDLSKNIALVEIACDGNELTALDFTTNTNLEIVLCDRNKITALDLSKLSNLAELQCERNAITDLKIPTGTNLLVMTITHNEISALDVTSNTELKGLDYSENNLSVIDITNNLKLEYLGSSRNHLSDLNVTMLPLLKELYCGGQTNTNGESKEINLTITNEQGEAKMPNDSNKEDINVIVEGATGDNIVFASQEFKDAILNDTMAHIPATIDANGDGEISTKEALAVFQIDLISRGISDASDIKYFTNISYLDCEENELTSLDLSKNTKIESIYCRDNKIASLDLSANIALTKVFASNNELTSIDVSNSPNLKALLIENNKLTEISLANNVNLDALHIFSNQLAELDITKNIKMAELICGMQANGDGADKALTLTMTQEQKDSGAFSTTNEANANVTVVIEGGEATNNIAFNSPEFKTIILNKGAGHSPGAIDANSDGEISVEEALLVTKLDFYDKGLTDASDIKHFINITGVDLDDNNLTVLDLSANTKIQELNSVNNKITSLDLSTNTALTKVSASSNMIASIDVSNSPNLKALVIDNNKLTTISLANNVNLDALHIFSNQLAELDVTKSINLTLILCGMQTDASSADKSLTLTMTQAQNDSGIFSANSRPNANVTVVIECGAIGYTLATIPSNGESITGDVWTITDAGSTSTTADFANLRSALGNAGRDVSVIFPGIESLPEGALMNANLNIISLELPKVTEIGATALSGCEKISNLKVPLLVTVGKEGFNGCSSITNFDLPNLVNVGESAFNSCMMATIFLPKASIIGKQAFASCRSLTTVSLPVATTIGMNFLKWANAISNVTIATESTITSVDVAMMAAALAAKIDLTTGYDNGTTVDGNNWTIEGTVFGPFKSIVVTGAPEKPDYTLATIPSNGESIPEDIWVIADSGNTSTTVDFANLRSALGNAGRDVSVIFPGIESLPEGALMNANLNIISLELPKVTEIGATALSGCEKISSLKAPLLVTVGKEGFNGCSSITNFDLPNLVNVGESAFNSCMMATISLPKASIIGKQAFASCRSLTTVSLPVATTIGMDFLKWANAISNVTIATESTITSVDVAMMAASVAAKIDLTTGYDNGTAVDGNNWTIEGTVFGPFKSITVEGEPVDAIYTLANIPTIGSTIAGDVWTITDGGNPDTEANFANLRAALTSAGRNISVIFSEMLTIPPRALAASYISNNLVSVELVKTTKIGYSAFYNNGKIVTFKAPLVETIEKEGVSYCRSMRTLELPKLVNVGDGAFKSCASMRSISLPKASIIGANAFQQCTVLETLYLPVATAIYTDILVWSDAISTVTIATESTIVSVEPDFLKSSISKINLITGAGNGTTVAGNSWTIGGIAFGPFKSIEVK